MAYVKGQPFKPQFADPTSGALMANGSLEFYLSGTSTPASYYTDEAGTVGGDSLTLNSGGMPANDIYYDTSIDYKLVVKSASGATVYTIDKFEPASKTHTSNDTDDNASVASFIASSHSADAVYIQSYYGGWAGSTDGAKGGHWVHKTGATNTSPTVGSAVTVSTIGTGSQSGYYWDADGVEWKMSVQRFNLYMFGCKGDGSTDDTANCSNAVTFAKRLEVPEDGNFKVSSFEIPAGFLELYGGGTFTQSAVSNITITSTASNFRIHGPTFVGAATSGTVSLNTDSAIQVTGGTNVRIHDCTFSNYSYNTVYMINCNRAKVYKNDFYQVAHSVRFRGCTNSTMEGNTQEGTILANTALSIPYGLDSTNGHAYGVCKRCTIKNNIAIDIPYGEGILVHAGQRIVIEGNIFENLHYGIGLNPFNASDTLEDVTISNNSLYGTNSTDWTTATGSDPDEGIFVGGSAVTTRPSNIIITGNNIAHYNYVVDNTNQGGIVVRYSRGVSITGNTISDCKGNGIAINDDTDGLTIIGNTIDNIAFNAASTLKNGIFMNHASSEALIDGNIFSNITGTNSQAIRGDAGVYLLGKNQFLGVDNPVGDFGATIRDKNAISVTSGSAVDLDGVEVVEFDASGGAISILAGSGMFTNIIQGRIYIMTNVGSTNNVTIQRHATYCQTVSGANVTLTPGDSAMFIGGSTTGTIRQATPVAAVS